MTITYRTKSNEINSNQELIDYINTQIFKENNRILQIKHGYESIVSEWVSSEITIKHNNVWPVYRQLINSTGTSQLQIDFWLTRGYSKEAATEKVSQIQSNRVKKGFENGSFDNRLLPSNLVYWTSRGYSHEEAKLKIKEKQTTFSLNICIKKYGEIKGTKIFKERQTKWQSSLDHNSFDTSVTWELYLNKYESYHIAVKEWLILANNKRTKNTTPNKLIQKLIQLEFNSSDEVYQFLLNQRSPLETTKSAAILNIIGMSKNQFKEEYYKKHNIISKGNVSMVPSIYGNRYYYKGHYYESNFELEVGRALIELDLEFICHKQYPKSSRKYDFYIPSLETYIECMGMPNKSYCKKQYELKHLNIIWSDTTEEIVHNLLNIISKKFFIVK